MIMARDITLTGYSDHHDRCDNTVSIDYYEKITSEHHRIIVYYETEGNRKEMREKTILTIFRTWICGAHPLVPRAG